MLLEKMGSFNLLYFSVGLLLLNQAQIALQDDVLEDNVGYNWKHDHKQKPHLIFILGDDIGWNDVGWHNPTMHTPFMNKLAYNGTILNHFYSMPQCTPSRATLLTGVYANELGLQRGVLMNQEPYGVPTSFKMYPQHLREAGYQTHMMGKWHIGYCNWAYTPTYRGFDSYLGFYNGAENNYLHCVSPTYVYTEQSCNGLDFNENRTSAPQYTGEYSTYAYTRRAVELINSYEDGDKPLFLHVAVTDTHFPVQAPEDRYGSLCNDAVNSARQTFCRAMAALDDSVKNITEALIAKGMYENSVIFFVSDNGATTSFGGNNFPLRGQKSTQWEGGSRVPAFVHSPLLKKRNYTNNHLMHIADISATMLRLAHAKPAKGIDGVDQWDAISKNKRSKRKDLPYLFDTGDGNKIQAVRNERYKLIRGSGGIEDTIVPENETVDNSFNFTFLATYTNVSAPVFNFSDQSLKLYDLIDDPTESTDISNTKLDVLAKMIKILIRYERKVKPAVKMPNDPLGDPSNFNLTYSPGWCDAFVDVPIYATQQTDFAFYKGI